MILFLLCMYIGVQTDINEGKFVSNVPVIAVGDVRSSMIVKVRIYCFKCI